MTKQSRIGIQSFDLGVTSVLPSAFCPLSSAFCLAFPFCFGNSKLI